MSIFDRIKAHQSAPDVYDPPSLDALMNVALAAEELAQRAQAVFISEYVNTKHLEGAKEYYVSNMNAAAAFRAACGEGE